MQDFAAAFAGADEGAAQAAPDLLARFDQELDRLIKLERWILETEENLKAAKAAALKMKQKSLPDIMSELRLGNEIVRDGFKVKLADYVSGSLPNRDEKPEEHEKAVAHLKSLPGGGELLRTTISMAFGKGEHNIAASILGFLRDEYNLEPDVKFGVPHQSLQAFAREKIANGEPIDTDVLGLYCGRAVKITPFKEGKKSK